MQIRHHHPEFSDPAQREAALSRLLRACVRQLQGQ